MIVAPEPMATSSSIQVSSSVQSAGPLGVPSALQARGWRSLVNITPWPTNTRWPMWTPEQMKLCVEILQWSPMVASRWISTKAPTRECLPIVQPYRLVNGWTTVPSPRTTSGAMHWKRSAGTGRYSWRPGRRCQACVTTGLPDA